MGAGSCLSAPTVASATSAALPDCFILFFVLSQGWLRVLVVPRRFPSPQPAPMPPVPLSSPVIPSDNTPPWTPCRGGTINKSGNERNPPITGARRGLDKCH